MIRLGDAFVLAGTKLRTRKTRTIVTAALASLLFAALVMAVTVVRGGINSYVTYSKSGLYQRYIAQAMFLGGGGPDMRSPELILRAKELDKQVVIDKRADAKRLGIEYDPTVEPSVLQKEADGTEYLNTQNYAVQQVLKEEWAKQKTSAEKLREISAAYNPKALYNPEPFGDTGNLAMMVGGKESLQQPTIKQPNYSMTTTIETVRYLPRTLVDAFILDKADMTPASKQGDVIPIIVPYAAAEKQLGLQALPKTATNSERLARIGEVKQRAANVGFDVCYRNDASKQMLERARQQIAEIEKRKNDKTYTAPSQLYALPDETSCGPVTVIKDTRTAAEKQLMSKQREFDLKYGIETEPVQRKLTFRIIGLSADMPDYANMNTLEGLLMSFGGTTLMGQWVVPSELVASELRTTLISPTTTQGPVWGPMMTGSNLVEFSTAADAKRFMTEQACNGMNCGVKPVISYYGVNSVLIDDFTEGASGFLKVAGLIVSGVAAVLMMGMIGRVITDSRRETAVFRAIGAKRNDIRLIYTVYIVLFSLIVATFAVGVGIGAAWAYDASLGDSLTTSARLMFIETKTTQPFSLVGVWPEAIALTTGVIVLVGFTAMLLPLSRNLVRSPLKDMRDE